MTAATRARTLTARGLARLIERGIRANFTPENQDAEIRRLAELFEELAMSRAMDAELPNPSSRQRQASQDADWLGAIAGELGR